MHIFHKHTKIMTINWILYWFASTSKYDLVYALHERIVKEFHESISVQNLLEGCSDRNMEKFDII